MSPKKQTIPDDEIDLREIILTLWKEKYLILIITLFFTVAAYIYGTLQPKIYQATITLRDAPELIFKKYDSFISTQLQIKNQTSIASNFNQEFNLNLMSLDNLVKFVEQNKKIDEFKSYLKTNNIKPRNYFTGKFQPVKNQKNQLTNQFTLNFSSPLIGVEFLNDYINFTKEVSVDEFKEHLKQIVENEIKIYDQNLEIAKTIDLENPILKGYSVVNEPEAKFYRGSKVISLQKSYLEVLLKEIDNNNTLDFNPILEQASYSILVTKPVSTSMAIAFILGLFLSLMVVFLKICFCKIKS